MKVINIGGKDYTIEFTIEASLYSECTEKVMGLMLSIADAGEKDELSAIAPSMSDIPQTTLTMFYAGLLEHHGEEGDGTVLTKKDAKKLIKQYLDEHKEDETGNFYGLMELMIEIMTDDDFFNQIGLKQLFQETQTEKEVKTPQDHKKKTTTTRKSTKAGEK